MEIRDILKNLREKNNLTQEQLAERVQVTRHDILHLLRGDVELLCKDSPVARRLIEHEDKIRVFKDIFHLAGSTFACNAIAPTLGFYWLIGVLLINRMAKKKIVEVAIGPVATIVLGIMVNLLFLAGLFVPV